MIDCLLHLPGSLQRVIEVNLPVNYMGYVQNGLHHKAVIVWCYATVEAEIIISL